MSKKAVNFRIYHSDHQRLKILSATMDKSMAALLNFLINEHARVCTNYRWIADIKKEEDGPDFKEIDDRNKQTLKNHFGADLDDFYGTSQNQFGTGFDDYYGSS